jgi:glycosyltransferase involved in cell wall biosynthesis
MNRQENKDVEKSSHPMLSVVVAVFRNSESLRQLHSEITSVASSSFPNLGYEIVFVDDGSDDSSWDVISELRRLDPSHISAHRLTRNFGQLSAMVAGFKLAQGDAVVSLSADLQDPTELIGQMVQRWMAGDHVVIANRATRSDNYLSAITSRLAYGYAKRVVRGIPEGGFDYFLMTRRVIDEILKFRGRFRFIQGDLLWLGFPTSYIPYSRAKRPHGKSGYSWKKRLNNFTDVVIDSSYGPIKIISRFGLFAAALGLIYAVDIVAAWLAGATPFEGWAPIMVVLLLTSGLILMMLGIIGAYIWRIYDQTRQRPMSVILDSFYPETKDLPIHDI